jgi:hypothetical protein
MRSTKSVVANLLFLVGIAAGFSLALISTWADYEAVRYFYTGARFDSFRGMRCPVIANRSETVRISATLDNPSDREVRPFYRVHVSGPLERSFENQITLAPGQAQTIQWTAAADDIDLQYFIMTKITLLPYAGLPAREAICGILVLNLDGLAGVHILIMSLGVSLFGIIGGLILGERQAKDINKTLTQPQLVRRALGLVVVLALLFGLAGWWLAGLAFCVLALLLLVILTFTSLQS